jgi:TonB family protein
VVPTHEEQQVRARVAPPYRAAAKPNTFKIVVLTVLGTLAVVAIAGTGLWFLQKDNRPATNVNTNISDTNLNTNLNLENFNFNSAGNFNTNTNANTNIAPKTPTPTPTPKPSPSVTPTPSPTPDADVTPNANTSPRATPLPSASPRNTPTPVDRPVNGGVLNGRAISLPVPTYPTFAKQVGADGQVTVQVLVDERGNVISAKAISGHPLLRAAAEAAARQSRISPARIGEQNVRTSGYLLYNFRNN